MTAGAPDGRRGDPPPVHLVCPVYYEQGNILPLWEQLQRDINIPYVIHFVYDDERDPTLEALRPLAAAHPRRVSLVHNPRGGVLEALKTGFAQVPDGVPVIVLMADLSDELRLVSRMVKHWQDGATIVVPSRFVRGGAAVGGPRFKRTLSRLGSASLYWLGGLRVWDATNNFRLYDADFLHRTAIESRGGFEVALELTVKAAQQGARIVEIPTTWRERRAGTSRFKLVAWLPHYLRWYAHAIRHQATNVRRRKRDEKPLSHDSSQMI